MPQDIEILEPFPADPASPMVVEGIDIARLTPAKLREVLLRLAAKQDQPSVRDRVLLERRLARLEAENVALRRQLVNTAADIAALSIGAGDAAEIDFIDESEGG